MRRLKLVVVAALTLVVAGAGSARAVSRSAAPDGPGRVSHFDLARKDCLGTARNTTSFSFCTMSGGVAAGTKMPTQV